MTLYVTIWKYFHLQGKIPQHVFCTRVQIIGTFLLAHILLRTTSSDHFPAPLFRPTLFWVFLTETTTPPWDAQALPQQGISKHSISNSELLPLHQPRKTSLTALHLSTADPAPRPERCNLKVTGKESSVLRGRNSRGHFDTSNPKTK